MEEEVIQFVQNSYTALGVSIKSYGRDSILLYLPSDCTDLSSIVVELVDKFNLSIDFQLDADANPTLLCWYSEKKPVQAASKVFVKLLVTLILCVLVIAGLQWV